MNKRGSWEIAVVLRFCRCMRLLASSTIAKGLVDGVPWGVSWWVSAGERVMITRMS